MEGKNKREGKVENGTEEYHAVTENITAPFPQETIKQIDHSLPVFFLFLVFTELSTELCSTVPAAGNQLTRS